MVKQIKFALILVLLFEAILVCVAVTKPDSAQVDGSDVQPELGEDLGPGKSNKVSKGLRLLLRSSSKSFLSRQPSSVKDVEKSLVEEPNYQEMDDEQVIIKSLCPVYQLALCEKAVRKAMLMKPKSMKELAATIRKKPDHVSASQLTALVFLTKFIKKVEENGYDDKLDKAINIAASKSPYSFVANTALNKIMSRM